MNENAVRLGVIAAALGFVAYQNDLASKIGPKKPVAPVVVPDEYKGDLTKLHKASREMLPEHRAALAEAFAAGASAYKNDTGTVETTAQYQRFVEAVSQFSYHEMGKVEKKYPDVADEITKALAAVVGGEEIAIGPRKREFASILTDIADAVR
jgi:hypothetical protein